MAKSPKTVRFRVPVSAELAAAVERLAKRMDRSTAWMGVELLEIAVEDRESIINWMALAFIGDAYKVIKKLAGKSSPKLESNQEVRLELNAPVELVEAITKIAKQWEAQSPVKAAGLLLAAAVHHHEIYVEMVTNKWAKAAINKGWSSGNAASASHAKLTPMA
jgi:predicted transcriptional regulator